MSALVKKEIRLLLPVWFGAVALAILSACLLPGSREVRAIATASSIIILAAASYGREFGCGTFALLLAQPVSRKRIWGIKTAVLAAALAGLAIATLISQKLVSAGPLGLNGIDFLFLFSAITGGLCASLFVRQTFAAFWLAWLIPVAIFALLLLAMLCLPFGLKNPLDLAWLPLAGYSCFTAWCSWRLYARAQDLPSAGERTIELTWPGLQRRLRGATKSRRRSPFAALLAKEFRLHLPGFVAMAGLFLLHLGFFALLRIPYDPEKPAWITLETADSNLWLAWLPIPVFFGSIGVAEERRLAMLDQQFCLPSSRAFSFVLKLTFAVIFGGFLPAALFHLLQPLETFPTAFVAPLAPMGFSAACRVFVSLAFAGFYGSTLARQTAGAFLVGFGLLSLLNAANTWGFERQTIEIGKFILWVNPMGGELMILAASIVLPWLAWRNFREPGGIGKSWRRTILIGLATLLVAPALLATAIYHRAWDYVLPPRAHGPARLTLGQMPAISGLGEITLVFPNGQFWRSGLDRGDLRGERFHLVRGPLLGQQFAEGSNWVKAQSDYEDTYAVRSDGTLWYSNRIFPGARKYDDDPTYLKTRSPMVRYGSESDWSDVLFDRPSPFLLKKDGSLWIWGPFGGQFDLQSTKAWRLAYFAQQAWTRGIQSFQPYRLDTQSDWKRLFYDFGDFGSLCLENTTGEVWEVRSVFPWGSLDPTKNGRTNAGRSKRKSHKPWNDDTDESVGIQISPIHWLYRHPLVGGLEVSRWKGFCLVPFDENQQSVDTRKWAGIRDDGTLWILRNAPDEETPADTEEEPTPVQVGREANWLSIVSYYATPYLLRGDGTIWKWTPGAAREEDRFQRCDSHSDWIALANTAWGTLSLSADGALWSWDPHSWLHRIAGPFEYTLTAPKGPVYLGNIFDTSNPASPKP